MPLGKRSICLSVPQRYINGSKGKEIPKRNGINIYFLQKKIYKPAYLN